MASRHHQPRRPSLHPITSTRATGAQESPLLRPSKRVSLTIHAAIHLKIVIPQSPIAVRARQTRRVELLPALALKVLTLDATVAGRAHAAVQFVVVALAVGRVVDHVEGRGLEGRRARLAHEAVLVVAARQPTVGG